MACRNDRIPYSDELFDAICDRLSKGETLSAICREPGMPCRRTFNLWASQTDERAEKRLVARREGFDALAEDSLKIVDEEPKTFVTESGAVRIDPADVANKKLRAEHRLKLLACWDTSRYGNRMTLAGDPENPLAKATDDQIDARLAALLGNKPPEDG